MNVAHKPTGRIHSFETFGTLDGPGIRFVLFMQGCALRCQYCHNPDSWEMDRGRIMTVDEVLTELEPYLPYYTRSGGGITVTGGEPSLQAPFVAELFRACKERFGLHTALDTSGFCEVSHMESLFDVTDLVLLDLKMIDDVRHRQLTGQSNERILRLADWLAARGQTCWARYVLVPELTDRYADLRALGEFLQAKLSLEMVEVLPYHRMGVYKWQDLGLDYPLAGYREPTEAEVERALGTIEQYAQRTFRRAK